jgi:hypothetical protein
MIYHVWDSASRLPSIPNVNYIWSGVLLSCKSAQQFLSPPPFCCFRNWGWVNVDNPTPALILNIGKSPRLIMFAHMIT